MNATPRPSRRTFLGILGALLAAPAARSSNPPTPPAGNDRETQLRDWGEIPRVAVRESGDPLENTLLGHASHARSLALYYQGGSQPGRLRHFSPEWVFRHARSRHTYVRGFCHLRRAPRILRVDRIRLA